MKNLVVGEGLIELSDSDKTQLEADRVLAQQYIQKVQNEEYLAKAKEAIITQELEKEKNNPSAPKDVKDYFDRIK